MWVFASEMQLKCNMSMLRYFLKSMSYENRAWPGCNQSATKWGVQRNRIFGVLVAPLALQ